MDLRQLRYFVGIVEAGSLSRAAAQLHIAQSAISHHLASLEAELNLRLVVRGPAGVALTEAGRSLYRHAQAILHQVEIAKNEAMNVNAPPSGRVSVGIPTVLAQILGFTFFKAVRRDYPDVRLSMVEGSSAMLREFVQNGRLDLAILFIAHRERGIAVQPLLMEELFYLTALPQPSTASWSEIAKYPLLLPGRESGVRRIVQAALDLAGTTVDTLGELDSNPTLKQAVAAGIAGTILPWSATFGDPQTTGLRILPFADRPLLRPVALCFPEIIARGVAAEATANTLKTCIRELVQSGQWHGVKLADDFAATPV